MAMLESVIRPSFIWRSRSSYFTSVLGRPSLSRMMWR